MPPLSNAGILFDGCATMACTDSISLRLIELCTDEEIESWLKAHKLMYQQFLCTRGHETQLGKLKQGKWIFPVRTCRARVDAAGPLLHDRRQRSALDTLALLYGLSNSVPRKLLAKDANLSKQAVTRFSHALEALIADFPAMRKEQAAGTAKFIQKDDTCFTRVKRGTVTSRSALDKVEARGGTPLW